MITINTLTLYGILVPVRTAIFTVVARNPIHAILWLISTFLTASGLLFHYFKLGFTCSLIIIVYIGAIAILFLFIIMMIPVKDRPMFQPSLARTFGQFGILLVGYLAGGWLIFNNTVERVVTDASDFWVRFANQVDQQDIMPYMPNREVEGISLTDRYASDIAIYGSELYGMYAFPIMLCGLVLLFVLVGAIVLCLEE